VKTQDEPIPVARMPFGREPSVEDGRCIGRWAYAAAWLADDRPAARELAAARLGHAVEAAMQAAVGAGRGDAERFALVSALARLPESIEGRGALGAAVGAAIDDMVARLTADGAALRTMTFKERVGFAPRFNIASFEAGLREVGPDRNVILREVAHALDEALAEVSSPCPALRTLRLFLRASLAADAQESALAEGVAGGEEPLRTLAAWLSADMALLARRSAAYGTAWSVAARGGGDSFSRTVAGLTSGAMLSNSVVEALVEDPWALVMALAMTSQADHASALLDCGAQAQVSLRATAKARVAAWANQARKVGELEERLEIAVLAPYEVREGHADLAGASNLDLFAAWHAIRIADEARAALRAATERTIAAELGRHREAARLAKASLETVQRRYEALLEAERGDPAPDVRPELSTPAEDANAQKGCLMGLGAAAAVMVSYVALGIVLGTGGLVERIGPMVVALAALPAGAAVTVQVAHALRRSSRSTEANRQRLARAGRLEHARIVADREHGEGLAKAKEEVSQAEARLTDFEVLLRSDSRSAA